MLVFLILIIIIILKVPRLTTQPVGPIFVGSDHLLSPILNLGQTDIGPAWSQIGSPLTENGG